jgi:hypothetical protein
MMVGAALGGRRDRRWTWSRFATGSVAGAIAIAVLIVAVSHKDSLVASAADCPTAAHVNAALGSHVVPPTAASDEDLLGCFYREGANDQAVSISVAVTAFFGNPCVHRPAIEVAGHGGCNLSGSAGAAGARLSLVVISNRLQYQFSTRLPPITLSGLEDLAAEVLAGPPPPFHDTDDGPGAGRGSLIAPLPSEPGLLPSTA